MMTIDEFQQYFRNHPFAVVNDIVYDYLYEQIVTMAISPGTSLNESHISQQLKISRTPVRNALGQLEQDGLVKRSKGKSAIILPLDTYEYRNITDLRYAVEGQAASNAAKYITAVELKQLKAIVDDMSKNTDSAVPFPANDTKFHEIIINASHNPLLIKAYELYRAKLLRYRWYIYLNHNLSPHDTTTKTTIHYAIYNALKFHSSHLAKKEAQEDVFQMKTLIFLMELNRQPSLPQ